MNVCLVGPPTASELDGPHVSEPEAARTIAEPAPLGVLSLAAALEAAGWEPIVIDLNRFYYECHRNRISTPSPRRSSTMNSSKSSATSRATFLNSFRSRTSSLFL